MSETKVLRHGISKGLRYAILERDRYTCQYCGRMAPEVKLTIDHVVPISAGGDNEHTNLVAACVDCNFGKGAKLSLREVSNVELEAQLLAVQERCRLLRATAKAEKAMRKLHDEKGWEMARHWIAAFRRKPGPGENWTIDSRFLASLGNVLEWLPSAEVLRLIDLCANKWATAKISTEKDAIKYFCGCIRNIRAEKDDPAKDTKP